MRPAIPPADILAALRDALAAGERDALDGGVPPAAVATRVGLTADHAERRLRALAREGHVVQVDGLDPETRRPTVGYLPPDHADA